jgi:hypothetical protein
MKISLEKLRELEVLSNHTGTPRTFVYIEDMIRSWSYSDENSRESKLSKKFLTEIGVLVPEKKDVEPKPFNFSN